MLKKRNILNNLKLNNKKKRKESNGVKREAKDLITPLEIMFQTDKNLKNWQKFQQKLNTEINKQKTD